MDVNALEIDRDLLLDDARPASWQVRSASEELHAADAFVQDPDAEVSFDGLRRVYTALCAVVHVDGPPTRPQREHLADYRDYLGLTELEAEMLEGSARYSPELRVGKRRAERELVLNAMIEVAAAAGKVTPGALALIHRVNQKARWPRRKVNEAIAAALERADHHPPPLPPGLRDEDEAFEGETDVLEPFVAAPLLHDPRDASEDALDPFAAAPGADDPFAALDPLQASAEGLDPFAETPGQDPFAGSFVARIHDDPLGIQPSDEGELILLGDPLEDA